MSLDHDSSLWSTRCRLSPMLWRIATFNIQNGVGVTRGYGGYLVHGWRYLLPHSATSLESVAAFVKWESIDALLLNEAEGGSFRSREIDYVRWLSERTELEHSVFFPTFRRTLRGRVLSNQGNAVLSKHEIEVHDNHRLPGSGEPRFLGEATIRRGSSTLALFTTHLSLRRAERRTQLAAVARVVGQREGPRVLMGDFNTNDLAELEVIEKTGMVRLPTGPSFPSWSPQRCLDHVFASRESARASACVIEGVKAADHLPVVATVTIRDEEPRT